MSRPHRRLATALLLLITTLVYLPNLGHEFHYDDILKIEKNPRLHDPGSYLAAFFRKGYSEDTTRLLPNLTFCWDAWVSRALSGETASDSRGEAPSRPPPIDPWAFHLSNLLIHLVNVWLVSRLGRAVLRRLGRKDSLVPLLAAALFAVHPLSSEAVNYCNARPNTMAALFYMLTLLNGLRAVESGGRPVRERIRQWILLTLTLAAALVSKELAVTVVIMMPSMLYWLGGHPNGRYRPLLARLAIPFAALVLLVILTTLTTGAGRGILHRLAADVDPGAARNPAWVLVCNVLGQSRVLVAYSGLAVLPLSRWLTADHGLQHLVRLVDPADGPPAAGAGGILAVAILCFAAVAAVGVAAVILRRRFPFATLFLLWPLVTHAPTSLVPRDEVMVEYRTYLPMAGICLLLGAAVAAGLDALARRGAWAPRRRMAAHAAAALALLALLSAGTLARNRAWATRLDLWTDVVAKLDPATCKPWALYRAWLNIGMAHADADPPRADDAMAAFGKALAVDPSLWKACFSRGALQQRLGRHDEALRDFRQALALGADEPQVHHQIAALHVARGDVAAARDALREGIALHPAVPSLHLNLAWVHRFRLGQPAEADASVELASAVEPAEAGRPAEASARLEAFLQKAPRSVEGHLALGALRMAQAGDRDRGAEALRRVLELDPGGPARREALRMLAEADGAAGRWDDGLKRYRELASAYPRDYDAQIRLGFRLLDRAGSRTEGEACLRRAIELSPLHPASAAARKRLGSR